MKRAALLVVAACHANDPPAEKLGSDDVVAVDRGPRPQPGELSPVWASLFVEGGTWKIDSVTCQVGQVAQMFGGWYTAIDCNGRGIEGAFAGNATSLWHPASGEDVRQLGPALVLVPGQVADDRCFRHDTSMMCLRGGVGIVGGSDAQGSWGALPSSW